MAFSKETAWEYLQKAYGNGRLGHAYLITGPTGSGKNELALRLCRLVTQAEDDPSKHPDVQIADPESKSRRIRTDQIRNLENALHLKANGDGRKVAIIREADRLQPQAANAFLKTLEEPPENCLLILITTQPESLLDTIISRCIQVSLHRAGALPPTETEQALLILLDKLTQHKQVGIPEVFGLVKDFQMLLSQIKQRIADEHEEDFKAEEAIYKQTTDAKWLKEREEFFKTLTEAAYLRERSRLLEVFAQWWADVLRQQRGVALLDYPEHAEATRRMAEFPNIDILEKMDRLELLRDHLERNIQENLALEVAFSAIFGRA